MSYLLQEGVRQALLANTDLTALIGQNVWAEFAPASAEEVWLVITQISGRETTALDGNNNLSRKRYQFTLGGTDKIKTMSAVDVLVKQFNGLDFPYNTGTVDEPVIQQILFLHADDRNHWDEQTRTYFPTVDFFVWANY